MPSMPPKAQSPINAQALYWNRLKPILESETHWTARDVSAEGASRVWSLTSTA
jgi:hypothetical protein